MVLFLSERLSNYVSRGGGGVQGGRKDIVHMPVDTGELQLCSYDWVCRSGAGLISSLLLACIA